MYRAVAYMLAAFTTKTGKEETRIDADELHRQRVLADREESFLVCVTLVE
jgi:hypothetical protein